MSVTSVDRSFRLLHAIAERPASLSELSRSLNLATSTASRFLHSLHAAGAVSRDPDGTYRIGPAIFELAGGPTGGHDLAAVAATHLSALAKRTGETVGIVAAIDDDILHLAQVSADNDADVTVKDWSGQQIPAHPGCTGLVVMAHWPKEQIDDYLSRPLESYSEATVTNPGKIGQRLEQVRRDGFLWTTDEYALGVTSVASPVFDRSNRVVAALHAFGPSYRFPQSSEVKAISDELCLRASQISAVLGHVASFRDDGAHVA
jgi:DNA-binding IclR family transcriptional regulator